MLLGFYEELLHLLSLHAMHGGEALVELVFGIGDGFYVAVGLGWDLGVPSDAASPLWGGVDAVLYNRGFLFWVGFSHF